MSSSRKLYILSTCTKTESSVRRATLELCTRHTLSRSFPTRRRRRESKLARATKSSPARSSATRSCFGPLIITWANAWRMPKSACARSSDVCPSNRFEANIYEPPSRRERARLLEKTMERERANIYEPPSRRERARLLEKTMERERANIYEPPIRIERAAFSEKPRTVERAIHFEETSSGERAKKIKKTISVERYLTAISVGD